MKFVAFTIIYLLFFSNFIFAQTNSQLQNQQQDPSMLSPKSFNPKALIGKPFPIDQLKTINNTTISLDQLKGKPSLINFWFTTCMPCIAEMPTLNNIKSTMKDSVNFIAITHEDSKTVKTFFKKHSYIFTQIINNSFFIDSLYMQTFPVSMFLDRKGVITKIDGGIPFYINANNELAMSDGKEFIAILRKLLAQ
ncbi:MAG: TlpA family protein disulfide reductase [Sphingobacteriia bacterium]|nr:MAG: TlpA family protein disulfide reductase [Sphingobacteriia bacterium]